MATTDEEHGLKRIIDGWEVGTSVELDVGTGTLRAILWSENLTTRARRANFVKSFALGEEVQANDFIDAHLYCVVGVRSDGSVRT